jgi:threonyl-tRNA synthetase
MDTDQNKRAYEGTKHTLLTENKIGGEFVKTPNAKFIEERAKQWEIFYKAQEEKQKNLPHEKIKITLKDGKEVEGISNESTPYEIGKAHMKNSILKECVVAKVVYSKKYTDVVITNTENEEESESKNDFELWDLNRPLLGDCKLDFCTFEDKEGKATFFHSSAHVLGSAMENAYGAKLCIGPALEEGFYYDAYMGNNVIESGTDYKIIEEEVNKITHQNNPFQRLTMTKQEALELFKDNPFKVQLITTKVPENGLTSAYKCGNFIDLCLGPHIPNTNLVKAFKILKNSGTNWLGKVTNDSLQRVYGISFPSQKELKEYIKRKEDEAARDHRNIGKQQGLFMWHILSPGSCFWYQPGAYVYIKLVEFMRHQYVIRGYQEVISPNIYNLKLWKTSGHYKNYKENLFLMKVENQGFGLKPMNCPGHCLMFDNVARSYKELPIRMADFGVLHRNEISGALSGLTRVRRFQQDDAHIFCRYDQIMEEVFGCLKLCEYVYSLFGFKYELFLSTRPEKMLGDGKLWDMAEQALTDALNKFGKPWKINPGDGAFYGPKIDIKLFDALGRSHQCGTVQLDFQLPIRFNLQYRTEEQIKLEENEKKQKKEKGKKDKEEKDEAEAAPKEETKEEELPKEEPKKEEPKKEEPPKEEPKKEEPPKEEPKKEEPPKEEPKKEELPKENMDEKKSNLPKEIYPKDEWDDEEFTWEEGVVKPGFKRPCIVHRAILGSVERFAAILIEHFGGKWPFWINPKQVSICTVSDEVNDYTEKVYTELKLKGYQVEWDKSPATLQKKIRNAQLAQFNYIFVIGKDEVKDQCVDIRTREGERIGKYSMYKVFELFKSLEPQMSNEEKELKEKIFKSDKSDKIIEAENKLIYNLYLTGDEVAQEDKDLYKELENENILREEYPNLFKWKLLMKKNMTSS